MSQIHLETRIRLAVQQHTPEWLRQELATKDAIVRKRAEETLAAMIQAAIKG